MAQRGMREKSLLASWVTSLGRKNLPNIHEFKTKRGKIQCGKREMNGHTRVSGLGERCPPAARSIVVEGTNFEAD